MKLVKKLTAVVLAVAFIASLSSCKRGGYGCPYDFKVNIQVIK